VVILTSCVRADNRLAPLLPEMLELYDLIRSEARDLYNDATGGKGGKLRIMNSNKRRDGTTKDDDLYFPFVRTGKSSYGKTGTYELTYSATYAILAAFRNFVVVNDDGSVEWKGGFESVKRAWRALGAELVIACQETARTLPEHKMAVLLGRNRPLWTVLHKTVKEYLTRQEAEQRVDELQAEIERLKKMAGNVTPAAGNVTPAAGNVTPAAGNVSSGG
jgi:hypothetical protein